MILTRDKILAEIGAGNIEITPFDEELVGPASVDLHLGDELRVLEKADQPIDVHNDTDYRDTSRVEPLNDSFVLEPGETVLGITRERIRLAPSICAWLDGRSRFARLGLTVHVTAGFLSPGIDNRQVLEISNVSSRALRLSAGTRLCHVIFQRTDGEAVYSGRFADQDEV